jgi:hypothetical protein
VFSLPLLEALNLIDRDGGDKGLLESLMNLARSRRNARRPPMMAQLSPEDATSLAGPAQRSSS